MSRFALLHFCLLLSAWCPATIAEAILRVEGQLDSTRASRAHIPELAPIVSALSELSPPPGSAIRPSSHNAVGQHDHGAMLGVLTSDGSLSFAQSATASSASKRSRTRHVQPFALRRGERHAIFNGGSGVGEADGIWGSDVPGEGGFTDPVVLADGGNDSLRAAEGREAASRQQLHSFVGPNGADGVGAVPTVVGSDHVFKDGSGGVLNWELRALHREEEALNAQGKQMEVQTSKWGNEVSQADNLEAHDVEVAKEGETGLLHTTEGAALERLAAMEQQDVNDEHIDEHMDTGSAQLGVQGEQDEESDTQMDPNADLPLPPDADSVDSVEPQLLSHMSQTLSQSSQHGARSQSESESLSATSSDSTSDSGSNSQSNSNSESNSESNSQSGSGSTSTSSGTKYSDPFGELQKRAESVETQPKNNINNEAGAACQVSDWTRWSACDKGTGKSSRGRDIVSEPSLGPDDKLGTSCPELEDKRDCFVECQYDEWRAWGPCDAPDCGSHGVRRRSRSVEFQGRNGGRTCGNTELADEESCTGAACVPGELANVQPLLER